ncbi:MAG: putative lipid II flippase FtsW [Candidatus Hydrogenedentota bacterium]
MKRETTLVISIVLTLVGFGVIMVYSATAAGENGMGLLSRQLIYAGIGLAIMFFAAHIDYHRLRDPHIYITIVVAAIVLLVLVLLPAIGVKVEGARRWIRLGGFQFQPSEFAKFALILLLAVKLTQNHAVRHHIGKGFFPPVIIGVVFAALVYLQVDLGIPMILMVITLSMMWAAGIHIAYIASAFTLVLACGGCLAITTPHRLERIRAVWSPWAHRDDASFQLVQSLQAFAQGGADGQGFGAGEQKLSYLFAAHTDFIFAVIGEELGLIGTLTIVALFALFVWAAFRIATNAADLFGALLATGITAVFAFQAAFIMAVTTGMLPTKGLPLPFVSYGGTALVVSLGLVGILVSVGAQAGPEEGRSRPVVAR